MLCIRDNCRRVKCAIAMVAEHAVPSLECIVWDWPHKLAATYFVGGSLRGTQKFVMLLLVVRLPSAFIFTSSSARLRKCVKLSELLDNVPRRLNFSSESVSRWSSDMMGPRVSVVGRLTLMWWLGIVVVVVLSA